MSESGVAEVYRILHLDDSYVVLDSSLSHSNEEFWVDYCFPRFRLRDEGFCLILIRDIMLAWKI